MRKLLIAEETEEFCLALSDALQGMYLIRACQDGREALALLRSFQPDILVLDLMLPELDGITILKTAAAEGICPMVLVVSRFYTDYALESIGQLHVDYLMRKPCNLQATVARIGDLSQHIRTPAVSSGNPKNHISSLLLSLGIPTKLRGYLYLREAILLTAKNPGLSITKELYPAVAQICRSEPSHVERSIRSAINKSWLRRDDQIWRLYFTPGPDGIIPRPTNAGFISRLADSLQFYRDIP